MEDQENEFQFLGGVKVLIFLSSMNPQRFYILFSYLTDIENIFIRVYAQRCVNQFPRICRRNKRL